MLRPNKFNGSYCRKERNPGSFSSLHARLPAVYLLSAFVCPSKTSLIILFCASFYCFYFTIFIHLAQSYIPSNYR